MFMIRADHFQASSIKRHTSDVPRTLLLSNTGSTRSVVRLEIDQSIIPLRSSQTLTSGSRRLQREHFSHVHAQEKGIRAAEEGECLVTEEVVAVGKRGVCYWALAHPSHRSNVTRTNNRGIQNIIRHPLFFLSSFIVVPHRK